MKKTIAVVGATEKNGKAIAKKLALGPYRLLLVSDEATELEQLGNNITAKHPKSDVETLDCIKDGCWEADVIFLAVLPEKMFQVAATIKEVATQKIVVAMWGDENNSTELKKILPYSKLVSVSGFGSPEIIINGEHKAVNEQIKQIFMPDTFSVANNL